ncbi:MAG: hypothetical protein B1H40_04585 [Candidatus Latescibacteria bacterium 4484_181]|nr:MAG: hypothetical protein B1H40_04585 [Candidatus Latescibacteria bacterium 4484_181]
MNKIIKLAEYTVKIGAEMDIEELKQAIKKFESAEILCFQRERRGTVKEVNIKAGTKGISLLFSPAGIRRPPHRGAEVSARLALGEGLLPGYQSHCSLCE